MQHELRKHFIIFIIFSGIVIITLLLFPFLEPRLKSSVGDFFGLTETEKVITPNNDPTKIELLPETSPSPKKTEPVKKEEKGAGETKMSETATSLFDSILLKTYDFASRNITKLTDKYLPKSEYYNYQEPEQKAAPD